MSSLGGALGENEFGIILVAIITVAVIVYPVAITHMVLRCKFLWPSFFCGGYCFCPSLYSLKQIRHRMLLSIQTMYCTMLTYCLVRRKNR